MWRFKQFLIAVDQVVNTIIGSGWADETLSAYCWRKQLPTHKVIDAILFFDAQHCKSSFDSERMRLQSPVEERQC